MTEFDSIERALADIAAGKAVVVVDDEDRENEGDLIFAAEKATAELMGFMITHSSGYICAPLQGHVCDALGLPPMYPSNQDVHGTAYAVSVDAKVGGTTGISGVDRARTARLLADPESSYADFTRPGHLVPLRAVPGGVLARRGHTEAAVDLARLAGLTPAGVICEIVSRHDSAEMARTEELREFATEHDLAFISVAQLVAWREEHGDVDTTSHTQHVVRSEVDVPLPTRHGDFRIFGFTDTRTGVEHVAMVHGEISGSSQPVLTRVHSECFTGDIFHSLRCDCGDQLETALRAMVDHGSGVVVYLRGQEGRGIGLLPKLEAYKLQDQGSDTVDANVELGLPVDNRDYSVAIEILSHLNVDTVQLITHNPEKKRALEDGGITVESLVSLPVKVTERNLRYLEAKRDRMGHLLDIPAQADSSHT